MTTSFFFFQAEDGIRDIGVTGVQTCAFPISPMAVARFDVDPKQEKLTTGFPIPRHTPLFASTEQGHVCRFRTCYPVTLWPLEVSDAAFEDAARYDFLDSSKVTGVLRLTVTATTGKLSELDLDRLRFHKI